MLAQVDITNYRGFKSYRVGGLAQVNLLVGKNNSGKTALLEGLQFFTSGGDPSVLAEVAQRRGELIFRRPEHPGYVEIGHFFHGHILSLGSQFSIHGGDSYPSVTVSVIEAKRSRDAHDEDEEVRLYPALRIDGGSRRPLDEFQLTPEGGVQFGPGLRGSRPGLPRRAPTGIVRFISTDSLDTAALASMWDEIVVGGFEGEVRDALRVLEPDVESVHMLAGMFAYGWAGSRAGAVVGMKGEKTRVPLGSMGDGMRRLLVLATSLASVKQGALFVDEIDTGLHFSVMADMWQLVVKRALAANVQVFATTHSWDCIDGLSVLCQREPKLMEKVCVHKIDRAVPHSIPFRGDSLVRMVRSDIDPR